MYRKIICITALLVSSLSVSALALTATQIVEREITVKNPDGSQSITREVADKVTPGEKVIYSLNYYNDLTAPANNIVLVMPIPGEIKYFDGSADMDNAQTTYSVDAGQSYAVRNNLSVKLADGTMRKAAAQDITHIRWQVISAVAPSTGGTLSFRGQLK